MNEREYATEVAKRIGGEVTEVVKNNGVKMIGVTKKNDGFAPVMYVNDIYDKISIDEAVERFNQCTDEPSEVREMRDMLEFWDKAKENIQLRMLSDSNASELSRPAGEPFDDLILVPYVSKNGLSVKIDERILEKWDVTIDDVFKAGYDSIKPEIQNMMGFLSKFVPDIQSDGPMMMLVTNADKFYGANCILKAHEELKKIYPNGYMAIPSSVHEFIVVSATDMEVSEIAQIICEVNRSQVAPQEVLGTKPYVIKEA